MSQPTDRDTRMTRQNGLVYVMFGRVEKGEFIVAHYPAARSFKSEAGAKRAHDAWVARD